MDEMDYGALLLFNNMLMHSLYIQLYLAKPKMWLLVNKASGGGHCNFYVGSVS